MKKGESRAKIKKWLDSHGIGNYTITGGSGRRAAPWFIDVEGDVVLKDFGIQEARRLPDYIRFRHVGGSFILIPPESAPLEPQPEPRWIHGLHRVTKDWLDRHGVRYYQINRISTPEGAEFHVDVSGTIHLEEMHIDDLKDIPDFIIIRCVFGRIVLGKRKNNIPAGKTEVAKQKPQPIHRPEENRYFIEANGSHLRKRGDFYEAVDEHGRVVEGVTLPINIAIRAQKGLLPAGVRVWPADKTIEAEPALKALRDRFDENNRT